MPERSLTAASPKEPEKLSDGTEVRVSDKRFSGKRAFGKRRGQKGKWHFQAYLSRKADGFLKGEVRDAF